MTQNKLVVPLFLLVSIFISCKDNNSNVLEEADFSTETVSRTLNGEDVYFIFTNTSLTSSAPVPPSIRSSISSGRALSNNLHSFNRNDVTHYRSNNRIFNQIAAFKKRDITSIAASSRSLSLPETPLFLSSPLDDKDGSGSPGEVRSTDTFYLDKLSTDGSVDATCCFARIDPDNDIKLSIWVADADLDRGTVTNEMVIKLANCFLKENDADDIYKWVTDIYGTPWGAHGYPHLIPTTEAKYITILLYDIDDDKSTNGGTVGYFYPKDNFINAQNSDLSGSNERVMFYIDSFLYGMEDMNSSGNSIDGWQITDSWPKKVISTLAHEFQHMIHFYQKQIKLGANYSETWLDEMCAMVTEDFVADKLNISGPRGTGESNTIYDYTAGSPRIESCRLSDYNIGSNESFLNWDYNDPVKVYYDYATSYAFGAYLARNYGGTALFRQIVQSSMTDEMAVVSAVNNLNGTNKTFGDLLIEWGKAVLTSDNHISNYKYNNGDKFESSPNNPVSGTAYALGSINLSNYSTYLDTWSAYLDGPVVYNKNISNSISSAVLSPATNTFYQAGQNLTGSHSWTVEVPKNVTLTVLVK